jgi:hypothetical protein
MDQPDWAKLLSYLHQHNGEIRVEADQEEYEEEDKPSNEEHEELLYQTLQERIDFQDASIEHIIETHKHLQNTELVRFKQRSDYAGLELTTNGFNVAHERELAQRNSRINRSLAAFTLVLVLITGVDVAPISQFAKGAAIFVLLAVVFFVSIQADTFDL